VLELVLGGSDANGRLILLLVERGIGGVDEGLELGMPLTIAGLAYKVSRISAKVLCRFRILIALEIRPPQNSAGFPGHG
jgi:hypothetical protein